LPAFSIKSRDKSFDNASVARADGKGAKCAWTGGLDPLAIAFYVNEAVRSSQLTENFEKEWQGEPTGERKFKRQNHTIACCRDFAASVCVPDHRFCSHGKNGIKLLA